MNFRAAVLSLVVVGLAGTFLNAQTNCRAAVQTVPGLNFFNAEQEEALGDVLARSQLVHLRAIEDEEMVAPLRKIVARLSEFAPESAPKFHVTLVDIPEANAFSLPGGRIFVTKKLIAVVRNEDELAGVLAHEMGHQLARQVTRDQSELWHAVLEINSVSDRADIEAKYHEFLDTYATNPGAFKGVFEKMNREQIEADSAGISLVIRAGYDPNAFPEFFDKLIGNRGKTGNWFSDFFGETRPDSRRFREMLKTIAAPSPGCVDSSPHMPADEFSTWRHHVIAYAGFGKHDSQPAKSLKFPEPLRPELRHLRFSPNGKYILAQDDGSIYVLTREPLANLFRIDAEDAKNAEFTADSKTIIFMTEDLRISSWNIEEQLQTNVTELHFPHGCLQSSLSPTGEYLACLQVDDDGGYPLHIQLVEVKTGDRIWLKKGAYISYWGGPMLSLDFSPDGRYLAGVGISGEFAFDLQTKREIPLNGTIKKYLDWHFAFLGPDTLIGLAGGRGMESAVVKFPSGDFVTADVPTGPVSLFHPGHGDYVILRPLVHASAGIMNLKTKKIFLASKTPAIDIYDGVVVNERKDGTLGLYSEKDGKAFATVDLPTGPLSTFRAIAASTDLHYLAYSDQMRGAIWDITTGSRVEYLRGFNGVHFDSTKTMLVTFPPPDSYHPGALSEDDMKQGNPQESRLTKINFRFSDISSLLRMLAIFSNSVQAVRVDLDSREMRELVSTKSRTSGVQHGAYLLSATEVGEDGKSLKNWGLQSKDILSGKTLWTRNLKGDPPSWFYTRSSNSLSFVWDSDNADAKELLKGNPKLRAAMDAAGKRKKGMKILEVLDHETGITRFVLPIDTGNGSFHIWNVDVVNGTVLLRDDERITLMDLSGNRKGRLFARRAVLDPSGKILAAQTEPGRVRVYTVENMAMKAEFTFSGPIAFMTFSSDGKKLFVLTTQQTVYTLPIT